MFPHTITIYNKYLDGSTEKWQRTVLTGVFWDSSKGTVVRKTGIASADGLRLIIPMSIHPRFSASRPIEGEGLQNLADSNNKILRTLEEWTSRYKKPKEWAALPDTAEYWTLQSGDIVILGEIDYEVARSSRELQKFDDVLSITNVDTRNYGGGMSHWEVTGK